MRIAPTCVFSLVAIGLASCASSIRSPDARIDGTSDASFDRSYIEVLQPLSSEKRRRFALALFSVLLPQNCLSSEAVIALTFLPASADRKAELHTCRVPLNGKSYQDIIDAADAKVGGFSDPKLGALLNHADTDEIAAYVEENLAWSSLYV